MNHQADRILELARSKGVLRTRDVDSAGASRALLASLADEGKLLKLGRGLYALPDRAASAYDSFAEVAARSENGVLCLLSALRFHDLTTQQSSDVWLAIPHKAHAPRFDYPPLRVIRMSGPAMTEGVETFDVAGTQVRVFGAAVADCWTGRAYCRRPRVGSRWLERRFGAQKNRVPRARDAVSWTLRDYYR